MFCFKKDTTLVSVNENIQRRLLSYGGGMMAYEFHIPKATTEPFMHSHPHEQIAYVIKGKLKFIIEENGVQEAHILEPGDSVYFKPNLRHGFVVMEDNSMALDTFTPQREDFL